MNARFFVIALAATLALFAAADAKVSSDKIFKLTHLSRQDVDSLPPWKVNAINKLATQLIRFRNLYQVALQNRECLADRDAQIEKAIEALEAARRCRYNGLKWSIFSALLPVCNLRARQQRVVQGLRGECNKYPKGGNRYNCRMNRLNPASNYLTEIQAVCIRIGRLNGPKGNCPAIAPLRDEVARLRAIDCGVGILTFQEIVDRVNGIIERIRELLDGTPYPSNDPSFVDISLTPVQ